MHPMKLGPPALIFLVEFSNLKLAAPNYLVTLIKIRKTRVVAYIKTLVNKRMSRKRL